MVACGLFATMLLLPLSGCGGGSGGDGGSGGGGTDPSRKVPVSGTIVDYLTGSGVPGYSVSFNGATATTGSDGTFTINAAPTTASQNLTLIGPNKADGTAQYYNSVIFNSKTYSGVSGIPLNATTTATTTVPFGTVTVGNVDTTPPFPPSL